MVARRSIYGAILGAAAVYAFANSEAAAHVARMAEPPPYADKVLLDTLFGSMKVGAISGSNIFAKCDFIHLKAAHTAQASNLDLCGNAAYDLQPQNSPTFTAYRGYTGNGTNSWLRIGAGVGTSALTKFTQNDAAAGAWGLTAGTAGGSLMGQSGGTNLRIRGNSGASERLVRVNTATDMATDDNATTGFIVGVRTASNATQSYRNGASQTTGAAVSSARTADALGYLLSFTVFSNAQSAFGFAGSSLTANEVADLYNAGLAYLQAVGAV
jgi:hypothetical protein